MNFSTKHVLRIQRNSYETLLHRCATLDCNCHTDHIIGHFGDEVPAGYSLIVFSFSFSLTEITLGNAGRFVVHHGELFPMPSVGLGVFGRAKCFELFTAPSFGRFATFRRT